VLSFGFGFSFDRFGSFGRFDRFYDLDPHPCRIHILGQD
jgi:hypothetical protein